MKIASIRHQSFEDHQFVEADISGFKLWFRFPAHLTINAQDASPFIAAALIPSMLLGETLQVDHSLTVSTRLLANLNTIQDIYSCWNPIFKRINITCVNTSEGFANVRNASFFSGGVDGSYTLIKNQDDIDDLILINGFDFSMDSTTWLNMVNRNTRFATSMKKSLVPVETNFKAFTSRFGIARYANFGAVLATIGLLLRYQKVFCSSSDTYRILRSIGSHPLLDPLWSTEGTRIVHTGLEADRADKLEAICGNQAAIENLWVCWKDPTANCGKCSKCLRTAVALNLVGLSPDIFTEAPNEKALRKIRIRSFDELDFYQQFLTRAFSEESALTNVLRRRIFLFKLRHFLKDLSDYLTPAPINEFLLTLRGEGDRLVDISTRPRYSDANVLSIARARSSTMQQTDTYLDIGSVYE